MELVFEKKFGRGRIRRWHLGDNWFLQANNCRKSWTDWEVYLDDADQYQCFTSCYKSKALDFWRDNK